MRAARFASVRDYTQGSSPLELYPELQQYRPDIKRMGFMLIPPAFFRRLKVHLCCTDPNFCNGFNSTIFFKPDQDDILISAFTVSGNVVTAHYPSDAQGFHGPGQIMTPTPLITPTGSTTATAPSRTRFPQFILTTPR